MDYMKIELESKERVEQAREAVIRGLANYRLNPRQRDVLWGMSVALQWVCQDGGSALERLIQGEEIVTDAS